MGMAFALQASGSIGHCRFLDSGHYSAGGPHPLQDEIARKAQTPLNVSARDFVGPKPPKRSNRVPVPCSARGSSASNSSRVGSPGARRSGGWGNQVASGISSDQSPQTLLQYAEITESERGASSIWKGRRNPLEELQIPKEDDRHDRNLSWAEANISKYRVPSSQQQEKDSGGLVYTAVEEVNLVDDSGLARELSSVSWKEESVHGIDLQQRRRGVFAILARDMEVIREGVSWVQKQFLPDTRQAEVRLLLNKSAGDTEDIQRPADILHARKMLHPKPSRLTSDVEEVVGNRTGVAKIIARDLEVIQGSVRSAKKIIAEVLRMRVWEDSSAAVEGPPPWPQPVYHGLSGQDLLKADVEALKSYGNYVRGFLHTWRIPLQLSYDPDSVASYFNHRPQLLIFRLLEVSIAFGGVALQLLLDKAGVWRHKSASIGINDDQFTLKSAEALKHTLLRLGPTFIKVAQSLSSRPDIIGTNTAKVLSELQDRLPPFPTKDAMAVIEEELGVPASQVFSSLSEDPVAAASFGQVYKGRTVHGEEVAVKVQRPDLLFNVARDIYVLRLGLAMLRKLARMNSDISVLADELGHGLFGELDYTLEAANAREFESLHRLLTYVKVPRTLSHLTTQRVLTMEWINGDRPLDLQLIAEGHDLSGGIATMTQRQEAKLCLDSLVTKGVECSLVQLLETGVMHADPHPGNLLYTREGILAYLDFGLLARVNKKNQAAMLAVIAHLVNGEWQCLVNDFADLDILKASTDRFALRLALERAFGEGPDALVRNGVPDIQFGQVTGKLWKIALKFRFRLPPYYTLVLRSLASLEGIAVSVDPDYKVFAAAYPYVIRRLLTDQSRTNRQVLQSLVLTQKREFRWDRISAIMATSRKDSGKDSGEKVGQGTTYLAKQLPHGEDLALSLLSFTLSKEGASVRRVLLDADTKSLAEAFVSAPAAPFRRKVSYAIADTFYHSMLARTGMESKWSSTPISAGYGNAGQVAARELPGAVVAEKGTSFQLPRGSSLKNQRLWFLLRVLASRLKSSPVFMVRVSWAFVTMVGFAAALALHKYAVTLSDLYVSMESKRTSKRSQRPAAHHGTNPHWQAGSMYTSSL